MKTKTTKTGSKNTKVKRQTKHRLGELLGHPAVTVIRAMGKAGWTFDDAEAALKKAKIRAAEHTIRVALMRGRNGEKTIAKVAAKELNSLRQNRR